VLVVMEAFGRALVVEPYAPTVLWCGGLLRDLGSEEQKARWLPGVVSGDALFALAHYEPGERYELDRVGTTAVREGGGYRLSGKKTVVRHGGSADHLIVSARTSGEYEGISLFVVEAGAAGVRRRDYPTQDGQRAAEVELEGAVVPEASRLGP